MIKRTTRVGVAIGVGRGVDGGPRFVRAQRAVSPVTDATLRNPAPGDWLMWRRTLNSWGYSPLDQINRANVRQLAMVWSRPLGAGHPGRHAARARRRDVHAEPARRGAGHRCGDGRSDLGIPPQPARRTSTSRSRFRRSIATSRSTATPSSTRARTTTSTRSTSRSGKLVWETQILDYRQHAAQQTSGPIIANGKVISGRGCEPEGRTRGVRHHGARREDGKRALAHEARFPKPGEPGDETWGSVPYESRWHVGTWMVPSYDPDLDLIYVGTSVTSPAPKFLLAGNRQKHLYHNSTLALRADTGEIAWYYQHLVDHWDLDHPFERLLVDTAVAPSRG